jgi:hypothetical protein
VTNAQKLLQSTLDYLGQEIAHIQLLITALQTLPAGLEFTHLQAFTLGSQCYIVLGVGNMDAWRALRRQFRGALEPLKVIDRGYEREWSYMWGDVGLDIRLIPDGIACHKVKVGSEMITREHDTFEIVCD